MPKKKSNSSLKSTKEEEKEKNGTKNTEVSTTSKKSRLVSDTSKSSKVASETSKKSNSRPSTVKKSGTAANRQDSKSILTKRTDKKDKSKTCSDDENDFDLTSSPPVKQTATVKMTNLTKRKTEGDNADQHVKKQKLSDKVAKAGKVKIGSKGRNLHGPDDDTIDCKRWVESKQTKKGQGDNPSQKSKKVKTECDDSSSSVKESAPRRKHAGDLSSAGGNHQARTRGKKLDNPNIDDTEQPSKKIAKIKNEEPMGVKSMKGQGKPVKNSRTRGKNAGNQNTDEQLAKKTAKIKSEVPRDDKSMKGRGNPRRGKNYESKKQAAEKRSIKTAKDSKSATKKNTKQPVKSTVSDRLPKLEKGIVKKKDPTNAQLTFEKENVSSAAGDSDSKEDVQEMASDDSSSESEWEDVEDLPMPDMDPAMIEQLKASVGNERTEGVEISIDVSGGDTLRSKRKQKYEEMWRRYLQWQVNKKNKELQELLHKAHLLCLLVNGRQRSALCNDMELQAQALSHIPTKWMPERPGQVDIRYLRRFMQWFGTRFKPSNNLDMNLLACPSKNALMKALERGEAASTNELVYICILLLRAIGLDVRLVICLRPITIKAVKLTKTKQKRLDKLQVKSPSASSKASSTKKDKKIEHSKAKPVCSKFFQSADDKPSTSSTTTKTLKGKLKPIGNSANKEKIKPTVSKTSDNQTQENKKSSKSTPKPKNRLQRKCASKVKPIVDLSGEDSSSDEEFEAVESNDSESEEGNKRIKKKSASRKRHNSAVVQNERTSNLSFADSECDDSMKKISQNIPKARSKSKPEGNSSVEELDSDSDFEVEVLKVTPGRRKSSSGEGSDKKKSKKVLSSESDESVEIVKTKGNINPSKPRSDSWLEVYSAEAGRWTSIVGFHDLSSVKVNKPFDCTKGASGPIIYAVSFDNEGSIKDLTHRYDCDWLVGTNKKLRVDAEWWQETLRPFRTRNNVRDRDEDEQLEGMWMNTPLPTTITAYKGHPLYALRRHLLKYEEIYPESAAILGYCRGEAVYSRDCVHELHTRQTWMKQARVVRIGEKPYKMVKARPKRNEVQETIPSLETFGHWQTEEYIPPPAVDGVVPRNEHGNVELFKECMLPGGTVHLKLVGLNRIARKLEIDCAPAMTGWDFHGGFCHPVIDGYVVCEEFEDVLTDAWHRDQQEMEKKRRKKIEDRVLKNWKLLIKGVLIRERLNKRFQVDEGAGTSSPSETDAKNNEKVSWPQNAMTAFEGDKNNRLPFEKL